MHTLDELFQDHSEFSDKTFGSNRQSTAPLNHLLKEVKETIESPDDWSEYADCLLLLVDAFRISGGDAQQLLQAAFDKLEKNKLRKWGKPDANGVVEHIR